MIILTKDGKPFAGEHNLSPSKIAIAIERGAWTAKELADRGLVACAPFVVPAGKQIIGAPRYVQLKDGSWVQQFDTQDLPPPQKEESPAARFEERTGITIEELKGLLA